MEYRRFSDVIILRLDPGDEILESITALSEKENIECAAAQGIGAVGELTVGVFDTATKEYHSRTLKGSYEIVSLSGTVTRKDGSPYLHFHMSAADGTGAVAGGHLNRAVVSATAEIVLRLIAGKVDRAFSDSIGLNLLRF